MATRDRTKLYMKLRGDAKAKSVRRRHLASPNEGISLIDEARGYSHDWEAGRDALPPVWVDSVDEINDDISKIKEKMEQLTKLHTKRLMITFDGSETDDEHEINTMTQKITSFFRHAEKILQKMSNRGEVKNAADAKTRQNVQRALATQLQSLSSEFRKSQKEYLSRVKNQKMGPSELDFLSQDNKKSQSSGLRDTGFTRDQMMQLELAEDQINERDTEIQQIATSIEELSTIFKELAVLVIDQGTILDRIDYNMEQVVERTEKGLVELQKAEKTQKSSRPMKCIGILLGLITLMTIILILKHLH